MGLSFNPVKLAKGAVDKGKSFAGSTKDKVTRTVSSAANKTTEVTKSGLNLAKDGVELSLNAKKAIQEPAVTLANKAGDTIRSVPGYDKFGDAASFGSRQTLGRVAGVVRKHPGAIGALGTVGLATHLPVVGGTAKQIQAGGADFVADLLETPQNLAKDPAGVAEAAILATTPGGQGALVDGYIEGVRDDIKELGVAGGLTRAGLDFVPIPGPKGLTTALDIAGAAEIGRQAQERNRDGDPNGLGSFFDFLG